MHMLITNGHTGWLGISDSSSKERDVDVSKFSNFNNFEISSFSPNGALGISASATT